MRENQNRSTKSGVRAGGRVYIIIATALAVALIIVLGLAYDQTRQLAAKQMTTDTDPTRNRIQPDGYYTDPWVYFIGDSYTAGPEEGRGPLALWPNIVSDRHDWYVRNIAVTGAGYSKTGSDGRKYADQVENSKLLDASAVVVSGGLADYESSNDINVIERGIENTMTRISILTNGTVPVTVLSVFYSNPGQLPEKILQINSLLERESARINATFLDLTEDLNASTVSLNNFNEQPTAEWHNAVADAVTSKLPEALPQQGR